MNHIPKCIQRGTYKVGYNMTPAKQSHHATPNMHSNISTSRKVDIAIKPRNEYGPVTRQPRHSIEHMHPTHLREGM